MKKMEILLAEDDPVRGKLIERAIRRVLGSNGVLRRLDLDHIDTGPAKAGAYEDRLAKVLAAAEFKSLTLILADRDLSRSKRYPGISEAVISKVADRLSIPICVYASGQSASILERHRSGDGRIVLDSIDFSVMAAKAKAIASGFLDLHALVEKVSKSTKKKRLEYRGPATVLAELLDAKEIVNHLTLYARGDQRMVAELMPQYSSASFTDSHAKEIKRVSMALGVWFYDSVLRFPGVILNTAAAASLLDISEDDFSDKKVARVFKKALYTGPFADDREPRWWRHRLVALRESKKATDGRDLVKKVLGKTVRPCRCVFGKHPSAGFVCVMTDQPVCEKHSVAQISWLPRGADLARVRRDLYDEIGPWVGMT